ncbi:MAG: carboxypeptidase-like regulatory domain-containing protein [Bacteroidota bacterium]
MKTKPVFYLIILFAFSQQIFSQKDRKLIRGHIKNDSVSIANVHVINISSNRGSLSNMDGEFKISVKENDTLMFSDIQYMVKKVIINKQHLSDKELAVKLEFNTNKLDEVVIFKNKQPTNPLGLPNADKKPLNQIERKLNYYSQESTPIVILAMLLGQKGGIDDLYNIISGNRKKHRKLKALMDQDEIDAINKIRIQEIKAHFKDDFFIQTIQIPQENINDFIYYCISKGIISLFEKERYLEMVDIFIKNKTNYLQSIQQIDK